MNDVQMKELGVYKEIAKICDKHNLRCFAIGGTCIGAVRHHGFIPWDDDIDIAMPRKDYELLRTKYFQELPEHIKKLDCDNSRQHGFLFFKLHDSRTTYVEFYAKNSPERYTGAFVDIMPVDGFPDSVDEKEAVIGKLSRFNYLNKRHRPVPLSRYRKVKFGLLKWIGGNAFSLIHSYNYYSTKVRELGEAFNFDNSQECIFTWRAGSRKSGKSRIVYPRELFDEIIEVPFEDTTMKIPKRYDDYLKQDFGDYMSLPPAEQRETHHRVYINDMNTPCEYYAQRDRQKYGINNILGGQDK